MNTPCKFYEISPDKDQTSHLFLRILEMGDTPNIPKPWVSILKCSNDLDDLGYPNASGNLHKISVVSMSMTSKVSLVQRPPLIFKSAKKKCDLWNSKSCFLLAKHRKNHPISSWGTSFEHVWSISILSFAQQLLIQLGFMDYTTQMGIFGSCLCEIVALLTINAKVRQLLQVLDGEISSCFLPPFFATFLHPGTPGTPGEVLVPHGVDDANPQLRRWQTSLGEASGNRWISWKPGWWLTYPHL